MARRWRLRERLQRLALATQWPPLVWLHRAAYSLGVWLAVRWLRRIQGVRSIYLRRGLAGTDPVFGLSDIDLLVLADDDDRTRALVRYHYDLVRQLVPMLAAGELGLYSPSQLGRLHRRVPFYRARFESGRTAWRRLWGEDLFAHLPLPAVDQTGLELWELAPSWYYLAHELRPADGRPGYQRRYTAYKALADACGAALAVAGAPVTGRPEALRVGAREWPGVTETLAAVGGWRARRFTAGVLDVDALLRAWRAVASGAVAAAPPPSGSPQRVRIRAPSADALGPLLSEEAVDRIADALSGLPGIERAVLAPRLSREQVAEVTLLPEARSGATVDAYDLLLVAADLPPARRLRRFNRALEALGETVVPYLWDGRVALATRPVPNRSVLFGRDHPEITAWLERPARLRRGLGLATEVEVAVSLDPADSLEARARSLLDLVAGERSCSLPVASFFAVFWEAGRAACAAATAPRGLAVMAASSAQIVEHLADLSDAASADLTAVLREYELEARGRPSEAARYVGWSRAFARHLSRRLFDASGPEEALPRPARAALTLSVVIVTRNRAQRLRRALESLTLQERPPDQVVVVDNASTDDTAGVALSFGHRLNLALVREEAIGIPMARNAGLAAATGDVVASMDDDCIADPGWLAELEVPFLKDPRLGAAGGRVLPLPGRTGAVAEFYRHHQERRGPRAGERVR